ncbi:MAG: argininosuccinate lyase, partial [bacterium]
GHYLLAIAEMLGRDYEMLHSYGYRHSVSPLGAGALSGTSLQIDPESSARDLGFRESFGNSYDVAGDRDSLLELVQISTQIMLHLSRLAEDFIYFNSTAVRWIDLPDSLCTGSSMMPQKKNPDSLELMRGKTASVIGHANALTVLLKGLPTSYQRDLQQDKVHLFETVDLVTDSLEILGVLLSGFVLQTERSRAELKDGFLMATELAEYLVGKGVPFRSAHASVGRLVAFCIEHDKRLEELSSEELCSVIPECDAEAVAALQPEKVLETRTHKGSTGLSSIETQLTHWRDWTGSR